MYPGPAAPELGTFVADLERGLEERGHELARAVVDRRGGRARHLRLARDVALTARRLRPDVVYAHFLVPAGLYAVLVGRAPVVLTAHGQDVENAVTSQLVRSATRLAVRRAAAVVAVSSWLRRRLEAAVPEARGRTEVIDCGVDLERFSPGDPGEARDELGWHPTGTAFLCAGSLTERKNVVRLARAFAGRGEGSLVFVGNGPLRPDLEHIPGVTLAGPAAHVSMPLWFRAADVVCQPSLVEPFGLATLEGLASGRSVVTTSIGGPPEFVTPGTGVLVDPYDEEAIAAALDTAAALPRPNPDARASAGQHDLRRQVQRIEALLERAAGAPRPADAPAGES